VIADHPSDTGGPERGDRLSGVGADRVPKAYDAPRGGFVSDKDDGLAFLLLRACVRLLPPGALSW
jgi:hypothetical protein